MESDHVYMFQLCMWLLAVSAHALPVLCPFLLLAHMYYLLCLSSLQKRRVRDQNYITPQGRGGNRRRFIPTVDVLRMQT